MALDEFQKLSPAEKMRELNKKLKKANDVKENDFLQGFQRATGLKVN